MKLRWLLAVSSLSLAAGCAAGSSVDDAAPDAGAKNSGSSGSSSDAGSDSSKDGSSVTPTSSRITPNQILLFGGRNEDLPSPTKELGDTWLSDGTSWKLQTPAHAPSPRTSSFAAANSGVVTLFGGIADLVVGGTYIPTLYGDTWTYDGNDWTEQHPAHSPSARAIGASASWRNGLLIFGGDWQPDTPIGETWFWDGSDWTQLHPAHSPVARVGMSLAPVGESLLLFGGSDEGNCYGDTWIFDGSDWIEQHPAHAPAARDLYGMATLGGTVVIGGGGSGPMADVDTTWTWSGGDWSEMSPAHAPWSATTFREQYAMVGTADKVFLFGGIFNDLSSDNVTNDSWTWNGTDWTSVDLGAAPTARRLHTLVFVP